MNLPVLDPRVLAELLDSLNVAMMLFDRDDRQCVWNRAFLRFFPEHEGYLHEGEPYRENLRRFYLARLSSDELPHIERFIDAAIDRHRGQVRAYTFQHRGVWVRVASLPMPEGARLRIWTRVLQPRAAPPGVFDRPAEAGPAPQPALIDHMADGVMVLDQDDRITALNDAAVELLGLGAKEGALGKRLQDLYLRTWERHPEARHEVDVQAHAKGIRFTGAPFELPLPGQRWVRVIEHRNRDGVAYCVVSDISTLVRQQQDTLAAERRLRESETRLRQLADQLAAANAELAKLAATDALTGLANRRQFDAALEREWFRALRENAPLALLMVDVDHFKPMNDRFGHPVGDAVLVRVAQALRDNVRRAGDLAARYGGEEFAVILPHMAAEGAHETAEGVRRAVAALDLRDVVPGGWALTVSIGLAVLQPSAEARPSLLVQHADEALYRAKRNGRNRIETM